ncbi:hypothetical protein N7470_004866 [Penicillium chermesinum]|nr:hypothetical protein N7470_004866 [Penicillium chermesinum]
MSYLHPHLDPIPEEEEITPMDHRILCSGGTTSTLEMMPSRIKQAKSIPNDPKAHIEELVYEVSYLRAELQWHKETKQVLLEFQQRMFDIFQNMEDTLSRATARLHESERRYLKVWEHEFGDELGGRF